ncbi:MAG: arginase [Actinobacteria bacterium]|nr:arginase [Actinomycetota bacterium]
MTAIKLAKDGLWQRANTLFKPNLKQADIALLGFPVHKSSITPNSCHLAPKAIRSALARYSTYSASNDVDLRELKITDLGDVTGADSSNGKKVIAKKVFGLLDKYGLLIALGGDNSITYSLTAGLFGDLSKVGLITLDAHHDIRDGNTNGSPVWRLIQAGLPGKNIVQIGISDFANSKEYSDRAKEAGIFVISRAQLRNKSIADAMKQAFAQLGRHVDHIYVDLDVDVCDRSVAPACPAATPGGISADELRQAAFLAGGNYKVQAIDITEVDPKRDSKDERTVRLAALLVLEIAAGYKTR